MTITQPRRSELYNWESFDVAAGYGVHFDQKYGASAVALNRVLGNANPRSFINGQVTAPGEVYVVNQNGILFGGNSQIAVQSLVAATQDVWNDEEFLAGSLTDAIRKTDAQNQPAPDAALEGAIGTMGEVDVEAGARIRSHEGGRVLLAAPAVRNAGRIETPGGQAVLAASHDRVYVTASADDDLRGLVVEVDTGGTVENAGEIIAERGNVSLVGLAVNQNGLARATTAVNFNGSVRLAARHGAGPGAIVNNGGNVRINTSVLAGTPDPADPTQDFGVTLGAGSVTEVTPETASADLAIDAAPQRASRVELAGKAITLRQGATVRATGGAIDLTGIAGATRSRVSVERGATIDVAGSQGVELPASRNVGEIELRGNELADQPLQRDGVLRGQRVQFDLRQLRFEENDASTSSDDQYFLPVGNVTAAVNGVRRGVAERTAQGGSVQITADDVDLQAGSLIDFSGGWIDYLPGFVPSTYLLSEGRAYAIEAADPDIVYDAIRPSIDIDSARWGVTRSYNVFGDAFVAGRFDPGYVQGMDAGQLLIDATMLTLDSELRGGTTRGTQQRELPGARVSGRPRASDELPLAGLLQIGRIDLQQLLPVGPASLELGRSPRSDAALFIDEAKLRRGGINRLHLYSPGAMSLGDLELDAGGELQLTSGTGITVDGEVHGAGAAISLTTQQQPSLRPAITVRAGSRLDVQGGWVNDSAVSGDGHLAAPRLIDGGTVSLAAEGDLTLEAGSVIDVGAGALLAADGAITAGQAGAISLASRADTAETTATRLTLDGTLRGYGFDAGGSVSLTAPAIAIGSHGLAHELLLSPGFFSDYGFSRFTLRAESLQDFPDAPLVRVEAGAQITLRPSTLGITRTAQATSTGTDIDAITTQTSLAEPERLPTHLTVDTSRRLYELDDADTSILVGRGARLATELGGSITFSARDRIFIDGTLDAPAGDLALHLIDVGDDAGYRQQGIWLGDGAQLLARGASRVLVDGDGRREGSVLAGGTIALDAARGHVVTAPGSLIDVSGSATVIDTLADGAGLIRRYEAQTLHSAAGRISLVASEGVLPYGSLVGRASGSAAGGDLHVALDLSRRIGNAPFVGLASERFAETARVVSVGSRRPFEAAWFAFGEAAFVTALRQPGLQGDGSLRDSGGINGVALVDWRAIRDGGFASASFGARQNGSEFRADGISRFLTLPAEVRLSGDYSLNLARSLTFDAPILGSSGGRVSLAAPYVRLGSSNTDFRVGADETRNLFDPTGGNGRLSVAADVLDVTGFSSLQGFGGAPVALSAAGDLRLRGIAVPPLSTNTENRFPEIGGALAAATDLTLRAAQVYPTTLSTFEIALSGADRTLTIASSGGLATAPLSAAGQLTLSADRILQGGTLRAPFGRLNLIGDTVELGAGSLTSVAGDGLIVPFGRLLLENNWVLSINDVTRTLDEPRIFSSQPTPAQLANRPFEDRDRPWQKEIGIAGEAVRIAAGAVLDLGGGGDLLAAEFLPGPGGSRDLLADTGEFAFAILPASARMVSAVDPFLAMDDLLASQLAPDLPAVPIADLALRVQLDAGSGLPAGEYTVLPRGYAILPGAYLITPLQGAEDFTASAAGAGPDGVPVVGARFAIGDNLQQRTLAVRVEDRTQVAARAEYRIATANDFFAARAERRGGLVPQLPADGGRLSLVASESLGLQGRLAPNRGSGRNSLVDITATELSIVNVLSPHAAAVELLASDLRQLGAESLLIGGTRTLTDTAMTLTTGARSVTVAPEVALNVPELMLAATERVVVDGKLSATGAASDVVPITFAPDSNGAPGARAFVRVSTGPRVDLLGDSAAGGIVDIGTGGSLFGAGSITLDGSSDVLLHGTLGTDGGAIALRASRVSIGAAPPGTTGLVLPSLDGTLARELELVSASTIDLYGTLGAATPLAQLLLDADALRAINAPGAVDARIVADTLVVQNTGSQNAVAAVAAGGSVDLVADTLRFGGGSLSFAGFDDTRLEATRVEATADASLHFTGDVLLRANALRARNAALLDIEAAGTFDYQARTAAEPARALLARTTPVSDPLGGGLVLTGEAISIASAILNPAGRITLDARAGDLRLAAGAVLDAAGSVRAFDTHLLATGGGTINLAASGDLRIETGARVDVAGAAARGADGRSTVTAAGSVDLEAAHGTLAVASGTLLGHGGEVFDALAIVSPATELGGRVRIDAAVIDQLDGVLAELAAGGFSAEQALRLREGDLTLSGRIDAQRIDLAVDRGALSIAGVLDASRGAAGTIALQAGTQLTVSGSLLARGLDEGGLVELQTRNGAIDLRAGSLIDVSSTGPRGGTVRLLAPRLASNADFAITGLDGDILGAARIEAVGNRVYGEVSRIEAVETASATQIGLDTLRSHNTQFMANAAAIEARLDPAQRFAGSLHVMPGIEIRSAPGADLTLAADWRLVEFRDGDEAGVLSLRAGHELRLAGDLDDGIGRRDSLLGLLNFAGSPADFGQVDTLLDGASWQYRLVAGADLRSTGRAGGVDVASARWSDYARDDAADVVLENGVRVRTGSGDIEILAGGDLRYLGDQAAVYTTGLDAGYGRLRYDPTEYEAVGDFLKDFLEFQLASGFDYGTAAATRDDLEYAPFFFDTYFPGIGFGRDGGDIRIDVAGDIDGPGSTQLFNDWLVVIGGQTGDPTLRGGASNPTLPTLWGVRYDRFRQNLGTLGGGDIEVSAGGSISDLSVVLPTTARPDNDEFTYLPLTQAFGASGTARVALSGGGDLQLTAGSDLRGGSILIAAGTGQVRAGGAIGAAPGQTLDGLYALGDASLDVQAARDLHVEAVFNYTMLRRPALRSPGGAALQDDTRSFFFTYGADSRFAATSLAGTLTLQNRTRSTDPLFAQLAGNVGLTSDHEAALRIYPGSVSLAALGGDVVIEHTMQLFPSPSGQLEIFAAGDLTDAGYDQGDDPVSIVQSDADVALLPSVRAPVTTSPVLRTTFEPAKQRAVNDAQRRWHAAQAVHANDTTPSLLVAGGSIGQARTASRGLKLFLAEAGRIVAGEDLVNLDVEIQHARGNDTSLVQAGRDLLFLPQRDLAGNFSQSIESLYQGLLVTGGGRASVLAGRDIDLGTSDGIASVGNLRNFALADSGADLEVFAGTGAGPDLEAYFGRYVRDWAAAAARRDAYLDELTGGTLSADALAAMAADLDALRARLIAAGVDPLMTTDIDIGTPVAAIVLDAFFDELLASGRSATLTGDGNYARGFAAIGTLFPADDYAGRLSSLLSRIHTEDGGDLNLFVPGGGVNAGAASTAAITKSENQLGVVAQTDGDVRAFVRDDFLVNASRVFALRGGNILMWASTGDIDAGRGAKGALAAPPPQIVFDPSTGQFVTVFPPEVAGSGIRNFAPPGVVPGDVFLFAPQGVVSAGDAGIASAGNITIGATEVIGADNIDVGGTAVGVPTADVGLAAGLTGAADAASASARGATEEAEDRLSGEDPADNAFQQPTLSVISVEVLGFGG